MNIVEINDLIIFKTVVQEGSFSKAAKKLGYVQPNVTERIKKLEEELGTPLLHRNYKGVSLLPAGEILLNYTNQILILVESAKKEIQIGNIPYRIGTTETILSQYVSKRIDNHLNRYELFIENNQQLLLMLKNNKIDLLITYNDYFDSSLQEIHRSSLTIGLFKARGKTQMDYHKELFFVSNDPQCPYRIRTIEFLEKNDISHKQIQQIDSYSLIKELVTDGKGLAFLPVNSTPLEIVDQVEMVEHPIHFYILKSSLHSIPKEILNEE